MPNTTQTDSVNTAIALDLSGLAASSTWTAGRNSTEIQNTQGYIDCIVTMLPVTATATVVGQNLSVYVVGQNVSFATNPITAAGMIDGVEGACNLVNISTLNSIQFADTAVATALGALPYFVEPFSVAQLFGGVMPKFWSLYVAHNLGTALAASMNNKFSFNGITYTTT